MTPTRKRFSSVKLSTRTAGFAALLALSAVGAQAQTDAAPAEQPAVGAGQQAPLPQSGAPAVTQPEWEKVCGQVNKQQECHISRKRLAATGQAIAQFMIIERGDKKLIQIAVPPVALIQPGLQIKIDTSPPTGVKYVVCTPGECLALGEINTDFINNLKKGSNLVVSMLNPQGKPVLFDISLGGFSASYSGPGLDPAEAQARQQKLESGLKKKADEARQQLLQLQQQQSSAQ